MVVFMVKEKRLHSWFIVYASNSRLNSQFVFDLMRQHKKKVQLIAQIYSDVS